MLLHLLTHDILVLSSASVIAALGILLLTIRFPTGEQRSTLRVASIYLALSCLTLGALSILNFFIQGHLLQDTAQNWTVEDILVLFTASCQALLFTMMLLLFIQPLYVRKERILPQLAAILTAGLLLIISFSLWEKGFPFLFYAAISGYLFQLLYYTGLFRKKYALCLKQLQEYYDEEEDHRLRWVQLGFYIALSIGVTALVIPFFKTWGYDLFIIVYTAFYIYMVSRFLNYRDIEMKFVLPAVMQEKHAAEEEKQPGRKKQNRQNMTERELKFQKSLENWTKEKRFSEKDIGVEEIAQSLGVDASLLRHYFRIYMHNDFRTWRSELRIREAQQILDQDPQIALSQVCETVGFNDKGNFHRQFQKITGTTPANYKQDSYERKVNGASKHHFPILSVHSFAKEETVSDMSRHKRRGRIGKQTR